LGVAFAAEPDGGVPPGAVPANAAAAPPRESPATKVGTTNILIDCRNNLITSAGGSGRAKHKHRSCRRRNPPERS
jgi:hypothetical protein